MSCRKKAETHTTLLQKLTQLHQFHLELKEAGSTTSLHSGFLPNRIELLIVKEKKTWNYRTPQREASYRNYYKSAGIIAMSSQQKVKKLHSNEEPPNSKYCNLETEIYQVNSFWTPGNQHLFEESHRVCILGQMHARHPRGHGKMCSLPIQSEIIF